MIAAVFAPGSPSGTVRIKWDCPTDPHTTDEPTFGWSMHFDPPLSDEVLIALLEQIVEATREQST